MNKTTWLSLLLCVSIVAANAIHWTIAMVFADGRMDVNALHNINGWAVGEGWFEVALFAVAAIMGYKSLHEVKYEHI